MNVISIAIFAYCASSFTSGMTVNDHHHSVIGDIQTCGEFFGSVGKGVCHHYGYANRRGSGVECGLAGGCTTETCCSNQWESCGDFFDYEGKDYCVENGFANRRGSSTRCDTNADYGCGAIETCCKNKLLTFSNRIATRSAINTCGDYFGSVGKHVCRDFGYANRKGSGVDCEGDCSTETCCNNKWETCGSFFASEGKQYCVDNSYANRRGSSTKCNTNSEYGCGAIDTCCKNKLVTSRSARKIAARSTINTCGDYFGSVGKGVCHHYGYANRRGSGVKCEGDCSTETCCNNKWETCGSFFASEGKDYCVNNGYTNRRGSSTKCSTNAVYGCGTEVTETCCKNKLLTS
eukprot:Awhi_evm1s14490